MRSEPLSEVAVRGHLERAAATGLEEDLGGRGLEADVTTTACVPEDLSGEAFVLAKQEGVLCGIDALDATFSQVDVRVVVTLERRDGDRVRPGDVVARVSGPVRALLTGERTAMNLVTHLSGIATLTRRLVDRAGSVRVTETRKTLPGLRALEKYAVRAGGGINHRFALWDGVLIKDNHLVAVGGVAEAVRRAREHTTLPVQVECTSPDEVREALDAEADRILLDNQDPETMRRCVELVRASGRTVEVEATGGINLDTVAGVAATGVDRVSIGALTHSAAALDFSFELERTWTTTPG